MDRSAVLRILVLAAALGVLGGAGCTPGEGPHPIAYDREPCSHCRMLISEPRFAAQLETREGVVESFDDPGCLLAALAARSSEVHALWFHHVREDRWLDAAHVAFEETQGTPMGYGLGAVAAGTPGALSLAAASAHVAERAARLGGEEGRP